MDSHLRLGPDMDPLNLDTGQDVLNKQDGYKASLILYYWRECLEEKELLLFSIAHRKLPTSRCLLLLFQLTNTTEKPGMRKQMYF